MFSTQMIKEVLEATKYERYDEAVERIASLIQRHPKSASELRDFFSQHLKEYAYKTLQSAVSSVAATIDNPDCLEPEELMIFASRAIFIESYYYCMGVSGGFQSGNISVEDASFDRFLALYMSELSKNVRVLSKSSSCGVVPVALNRY